MRRGRRLGELVHRARATASAVVFHGPRCRRGVAFKAEDHLRRRRRRRRRERWEGPVHNPSDPVSARHNVIHTLYLPAVIPAVAVARGCPDPHVALRVSSARRAALVLRRAGKRGCHIRWIASNIVTNVPFARTRCRGRRGWPTTVDDAPRKVGGVGLDGGIAALWLCFARALAFNPP